jgi:bis(5'-nucleosidyl)-tetraphosphatase
MAKRAAGFLIYRLVSSEIEYLLLKASYGSYHWTPPKGKKPFRNVLIELLNKTFVPIEGHVDPGEDDYTTALRETREEAGYTEQDLKIHRNISKTLNYNVKGKPKVVVYWLAELTSNRDPTLSDEHTAFKFLSKSEVAKFSTFPDFLEMVKYFEAEIKTLHKLQ